MYLYLSQAGKTTDAQLPERLASLTKHFNHHSTIVLKGLREAPNWVHIFQRETPASRTADQI